MWRCWLPGTGSRDFCACCTISDGPPSARAVRLGLQEDIVKLQIVNLASKLCLTNPEQTELLAQYVYNLARYDPSYDLRDRVRLMRHLVFPADGPNSRLGKYARRIFMATKPAPRLESSFKGG